MQWRTVVLWSAAAALVWVGASSPRAVADDETDQVEIVVRAPLDGTDCSATPPTITVLGLTIDVSGATFELGDSSGSGSDDDGTESQGATSCAALMTGTTVQVQLSGDTPPLMATRVEDEGSGNSEVHIQAPLQGVDQTNQTIMLLGLTIGVGSANLEGADDDPTDGGSSAIDLGTLMIGQFVEVQLDSNQAPLTATDLELKNFTNGVDVEIDDENGQEVDDSTDDVEVDIDETVVVQNPAAATTSGVPRRIKKVVHLQTVTTGHLRLSGMPTGRAKIVVTRGATTGSKRVSVKANRTRSVKLRLRQP